MVRLNTDSDSPINETKRVKKYKTSTAPEVSASESEAQTEVIVAETVTVEPLVEATGPVAPTELVSAPEAIDEVDAEASASAEAQAEAAFEARSDEAQTVEQTA
jgi:hypothetical protein